MAYRSALLLLASIASAPATGANARTAGDRHTQWVDAVTDAGLSVDEVVYPFDATPEMAAFADEAMRWKTKPTEQLGRLQDALFHPRNFPFEYDRDATLTATEAFETRTGNCLAFTAMFVALARTAGFDAELVAVEQVIDVHEEGEFVVNTRHVVAGYRYEGRMHFYDFAFERAAPTRQRWHVMDDVAVSSMYHANRGAVALRDGDDEVARSELRIATALTPDRAAPWVNLGVAHRRLGDTVAAVEAYEHVLQADPDNGAAWNNLAVAFQTSGRWEEAEAALMAAAQDRAAPFALIALADVARTRGDLDEARRLLRKARRRQGKVPGVYDGLRRWAEEAGEPDKASRYQRKADRLRAKGY